MVQGTLLQLLNKADSASVHSSFINAMQCMQTLGSCRNISVFYFIIIIIIFAALNNQQQFSSSLPNQCGGYCALQCWRRQKPDRTAHWHGRIGNKQQSEQSLLLSLYSLHLLLITIFICFSLLIIIQIIIILSLIKYGLVVDSDEEEEFLIGGVKTKWMNNAQ